jgi:hypothetical protein
VIADSASKRQIATAEQDAVIDLQHIQGGRQHQDIGHHAEDADHRKLAPKGPQGLGQLISVKERWFFHCFSLRR